MRKLVAVFAVTGTVILVGCVNSPAHRIEQCEKQGVDEATCIAREWDYEKLNPLPVYDTSHYDPGAALASSFNAPVSRKKSTDDKPEEAAAPSPTASAPVTAAKTATETKL